MERKNGVFLVLFLLFCFIFVFVFFFAQGACATDTSSLKLIFKRHKSETWLVTNRPIRLTQCCTQFKSPGVKILCVLYLHYNVAFTFK